MPSPEAHRFDISLGFSVGSRFAEQGCQFDNVVHGRFLSCETCLGVVNRVKFSDDGFESIMDDSFKYLENSWEDSYGADFSIFWELAL